MPIPHEATYEEVGRNYRKFLDWREKIVGGYVAVVGGLGFGYSRGDASINFQAILLFAGMLTSFAFWVLNMRNSKFIVTCVRAGQKLEGGTGVYSEMGTLTHTGRLTHGLAVNLLVSAVMAGSLFGLWNIKEYWLQTKYFWSALVCSGIFVFLVVSAEIFGDPDSKADTRTAPQ